MTDADGSPRLPGCLRGFPGAVLHLSLDGVVRDSNGRLEAALGTELVGRPFADALDAASSRTKWARVLAEVGPAGAMTELVLAGRETLAEPVPFSVLREAEPEGVWLIEHPRDERLDRLRAQVTGVNSELANTQRALLKERARLADALEELEAQHEELLATAAELERSNTALDEFARAVSHDLRAPLRGIANYAQWLAEDLGDDLPEEPRGHLAAIAQNVARLRTMVAGLLDYARAGRQGAAPEPVSLEALVGEILTLLDPPPAVQVTVDHELPSLRTARAPLQQVLQNLIDNAIKHARRDDARVRVSARLDGRWCEVAVADDGPGIPPALQERIWGLFHTLEPSDGAERTGIGLALVRRLVEAQGGRVLVESRPGEGATFRFWWPVDSEERG